MNPLYCSNSGGGELRWLEASAVLLLLSSTESSAMARTRLPNLRSFVLLIGRTTSIGHSAWICCVTSFVLDWEIDHAVYT